MNKLFKCILSIMIICLIVTSTIFAAPSFKELDEYEDKKDNLQDEIEKTEKEVKKLEKDIKNLISNISELDSQIENYNTKIEELENNLIIKEEELKKIIEDLENAKEEEQKYFERAKERIKVMYEYGNTGYMEIILASKDLSDFFSRMEYINGVLEYDSNMIAKLEEIKNNITRQEEKIQTEKNELEHLTAEANLQRQGLEELKVNKNEQMKLLENDKKYSEQYIKEQEEALKIIDETIKSIKSKIKYDGGKMQWPVNGYYRISSPYGYRTHPITGKTNYHSGMDIPAPYGTPITAAYNGEVIFAGYGEVFGNYIIVDHGSGYITLYGHNSKNLVKKGDKVVIGQVIAKVGSTGWSTGNHLHFGLKKNGAWTDPYNYLEK